MTISNLQKNKHLLLRAGFGANLSQIKNLDQVSLTEIWKKLATNDPLIPIQLKEAGPDFDYQQLSKMDAEMKKDIQKKNRRSNLEINLKFLNQMVHSEDQLREKMAFFWHGHFATRVVNSRFNLQLLNTATVKNFYLFRWISLSMRLFRLVLRLRCPSRQLISVWFPF